MAPAKKRQRTKAITYPCHTCLEDRTTGMFPEYNPTENCDHLINTCKRCLKQWIESQIETSVFTPHIQCPQCDQKMSSSDVEMAVTKKIFARYVELERKYIAENTPGWRWCLAPGCQSGQVHISSAGDESLPGPKENPIELGESKGSSWSGWIRRSVRTAVESQKTTTPDTTPTLVLRPRAPDICTCKDCGAKACVPCDRPWHENETCEAYKFRTKDRLEEEDKSLAAIQKLSKRCPNCSKSIEKDGGCRHMKCTQCRTEFCWDCGQMINHNGQYCGCARPIPGH